jgi:hypothetical protein
MGMPKDLANIKKIRSNLWTLKHMSMVAQIKHDPYSRQYLFRNSKLAEQKKEVTMHSQPVLPSQFLT